jgi:hypothetical protein
MTDKLGFATSGVFSYFSLLDFLASFLLMVQIIKAINSNKAISSIDFSFIFLF